MLIFIILSSFVAVVITGFLVMPQHYFLLNILTLAPLTIFFQLKGDQIHIILALTSLIWQFLILKKDWAVSKTAIGAVVLNEQLREVKEEMRRLAYHDPLTGLANRRQFMDAAEKRISGARRADEELGFVMIDLNGFKEINDTLRHDAGDLALRKVAQGLQEHIRAEDLVARLGGMNSVSSPKTCIPYPNWMQWHPS